MLGVVSRFGSSKGMVNVPALSGLTLAEATTAIQNAGLTFGGNTVETTGTSSLEGIVKDSSQNIAAGLLVDYETPISFIVYNYVYVAPAVTLVSTSDSGCKDGTATTKSTCSATGYTETATTTTPRSGTIKKTYSDGTTSTSSYDCTATVTSVDVQNSTACGYPVKTCTVSLTTEYGSCSDGYKTKTRTFIDVDCSKTVTSSEVCCSSTSTTYTDWSACSCKSRYRIKTTTTTCGSSSSSSNEIITASCTGGQVYGC